MARILYNSTHEALEYDDIRLFRSMGHTVFSLGVYCPANQTSPAFRGPLSYDRETLQLVELFRSWGCVAKFLDTDGTWLSPGFLNEFDVVISIQDPNLITKYWESFQRPKVVWRTVGQAIDHHDALLEAYREKGLHIVRWSDREVFAPVYIGHDAIIRGYKDENEFGLWNGESGSVVTFSNAYRTRYPIEYQMFARITDSMDVKMGGQGNEGLPGSIGLLSPDDMKSTYNGAGAYLYAHGIDVPYTLNFIEAMITGAPVVAPSRDVEIDNIFVPYNEVTDFIISGKNGYLYKTETEARSILNELINDRDRAREVGAKGRATAIRLFGRQRAAADWRAFFSAIGIS